MNVGAWSCSPKERLYRIIPLGRRANFLTKSQRICLNGAPADGRLYPTVPKSAVRERVMPLGSVICGARASCPDRDGTARCVDCRRGLGWVVDTYLLDSNPWGPVIGLGVGAAAGVRSAYRAAQRWQS